ncbi:MAG: hypothetical protein JKY57_06510 [Kordiimonadaceae bacterium]|nr:hypothetical protein [Kordiimonadaceae bacterium]
MPTFQQIDEMLSSALSDKAYADDVNRARAIFCAVAQSIDTELNERQREALAVSLRLLNGEVAEGERSDCLVELWREDGLIQSKAPKPKAFGISRLVLGSLIDTEGLSQESGEYLVWFSEIA